VERVVSWQASEGRGGEALKRKRRVDPRGISIVDQGNLQVPYRNCQQVEGRHQLHWLQVPKGRHRQGQGYPRIADASHRGQEAG